MRFFCDYSITVQFEMERTVAEDNYSKKEIEEKIERETKCRDQINPERPHYKEIMNELETWLFCLKQYRDRLDK